MKKSIVCIMLTLAPVAPVIADELADRLPADTLIYVGWPGIDRFGETCGGTALNMTLAEPEIARFRSALLETLWPGLMEAAREEMEKPQSEIIEQGLHLLGALWHYPTAVSVIGVPMGERGISVDVVQVIRPESNPEDLNHTIDALADFAAKESGGFTIEEVAVGELALRQITLRDLPGLPIRWGVVRGDVVITLGTQYWDWLEAGAADTLASNDRFIAAAKTIKASPDVPMTFVDIHAMLAAVEQVQPVFTAMRLPVIGDENGVKTVSEKLGLAPMQSLSIVVAPEGEGFRTTTFLHATDMSKGLGAMLKQAPLTDEDLKLIPRDVSFALAGNADLKGAMATFLKSVQDIDVGWYNVVAAGLGAVQMMTKLSVQFDLLGAFGDTWIVYDAPEFGGFLVTGIVVIAEPNPKRSFNGLVAKLLALAKQHGNVEIMIKEEVYRDATIRYLDFGELISPVAPAWAEVNGRLVITLYPQIARPAIDQILDGKTSLLDNPDFNRCRRNLPQGGQALMYTDTVGGIRSLYPLAMPLIQFGVAAARTELGVELPPTVVPSLPVLTKHLFGNAGTIVRTEDGLMLASHGALPISVPALGEGGVIVPALTAVLLPSLARARELDRRSASGAKLNMIAHACHAYASENDGRFPPDFESLLDTGTVSRGSLFVAPGDDQAPDDLEEEFYSSYVYISGLKQTDPLMMMAHEREDINHGEGVNALFLDGHVEWLPMERFKRELEKTNEYLKSESADDEKVEEQQ